MPLPSIPTAWVLTVALLVASPNAHAAVQVAESGNSHQSVWRDTDIGLYMDVSILDMSQGEAAILNAIQMWETADSRLPHVWPLLGEADEVGYHSGQNNRNTIRFAATGEPRANGALAITLVTYDSEALTINDADIVVNGAYKFGNNGQYNGLRVADSVPSSYDLSDVMAHEVGHFFGLPDNLDDSTAIMYPFFDAGETRRNYLSESDLQALDSLYSASSAKSNTTGACSVARVRQRVHPLRSDLGFWLLGMALSFQMARRAKRVARRPLRDS